MRPAGNSSACYKDYVKAGSPHYKWGYKRRAAILTYPARVWPLTLLLLLAGIFTPTGTTLDGNLQPDLTFGPELHRVILRPTDLHSTTAGTTDSARQGAYTVAAKGTDQTTKSLAAINGMLSKAGFTSKLVRPMSGGAFVFEISTRKPVHTMLALFQQMTQQGILEYGQLDSAVKPTTIPNDQLFDVQWHMGSVEQTIASLNLTNAWDLTQGSAEVVVAIIDTGVRFEHDDLAGRLLPGYDFVSGINENRVLDVVPDSMTYIKANDGDGRDSDATDPGDGVDGALNELMESYDLECPIQESSWHGTAMASLIAANGNDGIGMTGVDWRAQILPVRAIGRCGGRRSDLLDAIRWAAGFPDPALPPNPTPARIINLSLGIDDKCALGDQRAINDAVAMGAFVVAAVGNLGRDLDLEPSSPSHCNNVFGVTAVNASGLRANYSSYGRDADIAAPGGEGLSGDNQPILVATNDGYIEPQAGNSHRYTTGTSVASPMVAGIASLMLSVNPSLSNTELRALLKSTVRPFPSSEDPLACTPSTCGSGLIDAFSAVKAAASFDPSQPGPLAAALLDEESQVIAGGSATTSPLWLLILGLSGLACRRMRRPINTSLRTKGRMTKKLRL